MSFSPVGHLTVLWRNRDVFYTIARDFGEQKTQKQGKENKLTACLNFTPNDTSTLSCLIRGGFISILYYLQILNWVQLQNQN